MLASPWERQGRACPPLGKGRGRACTSLGKAGAGPAPPGKGRAGLVEMVLLEPSRGSPRLRRPGPQARHLRFLGPALASFGL